MKKTMTIMAMAALLSIGWVKAQTQSPDTTARYFLIQASIGNLQEIAAGRLAAQKATSADIKDFGKMMVDDHSKTEAKLQQLAKAQNIQLPAAATETPVPDMNLKKASGADFNRIYVHNMVPGHRETLLLFQTYVAAGKNAAVKAFAQQTIPTLKEHLAAITTIDKNLKDPAAK